MLQLSVTLPHLFKQVVAMGALVQLQVLLLHVLLGGVQSVVVQHAVAPLAMQRLAPHDMKLVAHV